MIFKIKTCIQENINMSKEYQSKPYLRLPIVYDPPPVTHSLKTRRFQGIPSMAVSLKGRLWATWYAGKTPGEDRNNYTVIAGSGTDGRTWNEYIVIDPDGEGPVRAFDPQLWLDPTGKLWAFWAQTIEHKGTVAGVWAMTNDTPEAADSSWSEPRRLTDGVMMCKPVVLSSGEWLLPASTWRETDNSARVVASNDQGHIWKLRGACHVHKNLRSYDEHMIVEKNNGTLWMLVRTTEGIAESLSVDRGRTWSALKPSALKHTSSRFFIRRLSSGNLLLVKHGPINRKTERSHLTAYLSDNDGQSWSNGLLIDERKGISYPDGQQDKYGNIYIIYDRSRTNAREILMSKFTENDIYAGRLINANSALKIIVSKPSA
jgi:predicted neuraminidase